MPPRREEIVRHVAVVAAVHDDGIQRDDVRFEPADQRPAIERRVIQDRRGRLPLRRQPLLPKRQTENE